MQPEKALQNEIMGYLDFEKIFRFQINNSLTFDKNLGAYRKKNRWFVYGVSDIIGIYKGKFFAVEVKTKTGRLSEHQKIFLNNVKTNGGIAIVARSIDDVKRGLDEGLLVTTEPK